MLLLLLKVNAELFWSCLISEPLSSREELHLQTLKAFVDLHEFSDLNLVQALRSVLLIFTAAGLQLVRTFYPAYSEWKGLLLKNQKLQGCYVCCLAEGGGCTVQCVISSPSVARLKKNKTGSCSRCSWLMYER